MVLDEWAAEFGIPAHAMQVLKLRIGIQAAAATPPIAVPPTSKASEARQQSLIRLAAAETGRVWLTRNNVGALQDSRGVPVRYGLCNESKEQNEALKSADLIGWESIMITPQHVGRVIAQFLSVEAKEEGWVYTGNAHERGQLNWANLVNSRGGKAFFANGPEQFKTQLGVQQ